MSAPFTPGPWQTKSDYTHEDRCTIIGNVDGEYVDGRAHCTFDTIAICRDEFEEYVNESEANARLIATAPELLGACEGMLGLCQLLLARDDLPADVRASLAESHRVVAAKAAVTKARGEA